MELKQYFEILWRRKWVILIVLATTIIAIGIGHYFTTPTYTATATLRVAVTVGGAQTPSIFSYSDQLINTYVEIASSRPVQEELMSRLDSDQLPILVAEAIPNTELIRVTAQDQNPKLAAKAANTLAEILIEQSDQLYSGGSKGSVEIIAAQLEESKVNLDKMRGEYEALIVQTPASPDQITVTGQLLQEKQRTYETLLRQYEQAKYREAIESSMITLVESAITPTTSSKPRVALNYTLGVVLGLVGGLILAFVFENMDTHLYDPADIESATRTSLLAVFPKTGKRHLILSHNGSSPLAEAARHIAAQIQWMDRQTSRRVILLAGSEPRQGTTTIAVNLALALVEQGRNVIIIDYNLRNPNLHEILGLPNEHGLVDVLAESMDWKKVVQKSPDGCLSVLTAGYLSASPLMTFNFARAEKLINSLRPQFDYIMLDAPDLTVADMVSLAPFMDGLILVVRRALARREAVEAAGKLMARFEGKLIGLIVNDA